MLKPRTPLGCAELMDGFARSKTSGQFPRNRRLLQQYLPEADVRERRGDTLDLGCPKSRPGNFVLKSRRPLFATTKRGAIAPTPPNTERRAPHRDAPAADMRLSA